MKMTKTGKQTLYLYEGVLPKSGKQQVKFADHTLVHRSIKADKSDLLVHLETRVIIRSYPLGTDRSIVLNDLAENFKRLEHFLHHRESYEVQTRPKPQKKKDNDADTVYDISMSHYSDGSCVQPRVNKVKEIKKYNQRNFKW